MGDTRCQELPQAGDGAGPGCPISGMGCRRANATVLQLSSSPGQLCSLPLAEPKHRWLKATAGAQSRRNGATALCPQPLPGHDSLCMAEHPEHAPAAPGCPTSQPQSLLFSRSSPHQQARTGGWYMNTDVEELHRQIYTAFVQRKKMNQITK